MAKKYNSIHTKDTFYKALSIVVLILVVWYISAWYNIKKTERLLYSYLISSNTITYEINSLKEFDSVLKETPSEYFIYISYTGSEKIYNFEKKLKKVIDEYNLSDQFYYIDVTKKKDDLTYLEDLNEKLSSDIKYYPTILYYKNGKLEKTFSDKKGNININDIKNLLKENTND